ncbi:TraI domain-containing protein [Salmonella sp. WGH-01]|nr:TraI domain-containing protein [Salmonella sp. WGH-01]
MSETPGFGSGKICLYRRHGGLRHTDDGLCRTFIKGYMLPRGASAEEQSAQSVSWSAVVYYAALFHSLGRLWNIEGELRSGAVWRPGLSVPEEPYRFRFKAEPDIAGAQVYGELIALRFLPEPVLQWLGKTLIF